MREVSFTNLSIEEQERLLRLARSSGLKRKTVALPVITRAERGEGLPLSFAQQRLWFLAQMEGVSEAYHVPFGVRLHGELDRGALRRALDRVVARHEALRTTFISTGGESEQRIASEEGSRFHLVEHDLRECNDGQSELQSLIAQEARTPFDLEAGPLIRGRLIRQAEDEHTLLITMHHIVSDGWSMGVMLKELSVLYGAFAKGEGDPLPELSLQYADYAVWQREWIEGDILQRQADYWKTALAGVPAVLELPGDHARPAQQDHAGAWVKLVLDEELTAGLKELSRRHGTTLYMTLLAGWAGLLGRLSGQPDVVVGTPVANRGRMEIEGLIGFFVNTLALRLDLSGLPSVGDLLQQAKKQTLAAQEHQDIPFEQVVEIIRPVRSLSHSPIFQVVFDWTNTPEIQFELLGLKVKPMESAPHIVSKFDLTLSLQEAGERIVGGVEYATSLFERGTIERYLGYFRRLLEGMVAEDAQVMDRLPLLAEWERDRVLYEWNDTRVEYPREKCVHELFEEQVEKTPEAVAVVFEDASLTYGQLNERANQLARYLVELGVRPDDRVAICVERSPEMVVGLLAILKAGGAYVPLDPAYPEDRLRFMLEDSAPVVVLTQGHLRGQFSEVGSRLQVLDLMHGAAWQEQPETDPDRAALGLISQHLAYVIYTSGSTGMPKGVMVEHGHVARLFAATDKWFRFNGSDIWTLFHSYAFDFSVWEIWGALMYGGRLIVISKDTARSPEDFYKLVCQEKVTILNQTPSAFRQLIAAQGKSNESHRLRHIIFGGEALEVATLRPWYEQNEGGETQLTNMYGITETTVHVTYRPLERADTERRGGSPVGWRIPDLKVYILDTHGEPVPVGVAGELYVGGAGVARGYLNRPELTAERFLKDPFVAEAGARMYRTGDIGRWLADGTIEFLGRNDEQVKIRGYRIELGEIESVLASHAAIKEAVVVAREDTPGEKRLVAYYTTGDEPLGAEELRSHLSSKLPEYMVPAAYVRLEALPLTANGKLDRKALPVPGADAYLQRGYEPPQGEIETLIAEVWAELLKVERVGRRDNFFELGGHSLLAITLIERMRRRGLQVDVGALFATPTLAELAAAVDPQVSVVEVPLNRISLECEAITPELLPLVKLSQEEIDRIVEVVPGGARNVQDIYPLAPFQEGILFHYLIGGEGDVYLNSRMESFSARSRLDDYLRALQAVIDRHDILRTGVVWQGLSEPVQVVWRKAVLQVEEVELDPKVGDVEDQLWRRFDPRRNRLDIRQAPMLRMFVTYDTEHQRWLLRWWYSHLLEDHVTLQVMQEEIRAHLLRQADRLPKPQPFRNLVAQARLGVSKEEHEVFFRRLLGDVDEPTAPFGLVDAQGDGKGIEEGQVLLDSTLARRIRERARKLRVSVASLWHVAWAQVLARVSGREDVVFGTVLFGRMQGGAGADRALGPFMNTLPVRIPIGGEPVEVTVLQTHGHLGELLRHEHASLALAQRCSAVPAPAPLFTALLNYRHSAMSSSEWEGDRVAGGWEGVEYLASEERTNYPLVLNLDDLGGGFALTMQSDWRIDPRRVCAMMQRALETLVEALETTPNRPVGELDVLPGEERRRLLYEWNDTEVEYPSDRCIHELFEEQVLKSPDAVAVVFEEQQVSYTELNRRANQLARYLVELGVRPDDRVAICVERSPEMVVGLLAILKAGGAYVPLDPAYPRERLRYMLEDSAPVAVLTHGLARNELEKALESLRIRPEVVDVEKGSWGEPSAGNPNPRSLGLTSRHLAYVIYTSGSTGNPKGIKIKHSSVLNLIDWVNKTFRISSGDRLLFVTSICFDLSVYDIFGILAAGATVWIADQMTVNNPERLSEIIVNERITFWDSAPAALQMLVPFLKADFSKCSVLRLVFNSGDWIPLSLPSAISSSFPGVRFISLGGATEATIWSNWYEVGEISNDWVSIPYGRPIQNSKYYVLDTHLSPCPIGVRGALYISGKCLAEGYTDSRLTAERFIANPFVEGDRLYKTGDLARYLPDGNIEFLGRNDFQVKIRGYRIELGEIERRLGEYPGVREAVLMVREDAPGEKRLVAYYTVADDREAIEAEHLRLHLSAFLPEYMVPAAYVRLEALPLTANGKLDRKGLPAPDGDAYVRRVYEAPSGPVETALAKIWSEVLKIDRVGRHDNFFELGGHSLIAILVLDRMRREGLHADVRALFATPVLSVLARSIDEVLELRL